MSLLLELQCPNYDWVNPLTNDELSGFIQTKFAKYRLSRYCMSYESKVEQILCNECNQEFEQTTRVPAL